MSNLFKLRPYQSDVTKELYASWAAGNRNVLVVLPTSAGKTVTFAKIFHDHIGASCAIAHRQELVAQISLALARDEIRHRIIGPRSVVKLCVNIHMAELGRSYYDPTAQCAVAGIDTLVRRGAELDQWLKTVTLWVQDEAHHVLKDNKWGRGAEMFPNARGAGFTATALRADGKGLGREYDGLFDDMVVGVDPTMAQRKLINMGYITDYRIFAPGSDIDLSSVAVSKTTGDWARNGLVKAVHKSHIVGDVVKEYLKITPGKLGVTFATDVQTATGIADQFNSQGVPAAVVCAKTPDSDRVAIVNKFKRRELLQLVNVDLFGEGFDLPAIEVISMARPTESYGLYVQQFGRVLRLLIPKEWYKFWDTLTDEQRREHIAKSEKPMGIIIDHVNNVERHGLPDAPRTWSLERRSRKSKSKEGEIPVKTCPQCTAVYTRLEPVCPYCGFKPIPAERTLPEMVDGDLTELDPETLAKMRGEVVEAVKPIEDYRVDLVSRRVPLIGQLAGVKRHAARIDALEALKHSIAWWAGFQRSQGRLDPESYKRFYFMFGLDVLSAQSLKRPEALQLAEKINLHLAKGV